RFDAVDFAAFDIHMLKRPGAAEAVPAAIAEDAGRRFLAMNEDAKRRLASSVLAGLPGAADTLTVGNVQEHLDRYGHISKDKLRTHLLDFLSEVVPVAEELGLRLCCHPDDPP